MQGETHSVVLPTSDWGVVLEALRNVGGTEERRVAELLRQQIAPTGGTDGKPITREDSPEVVGKIDSPVGEGSGE